MARPFCAVCASDADDLVHDSDLGVKVCARCRTEHPRAGGYDLAPIADHTSENGRARAGNRWRTGGRARVRIRRAP